MVSIVRDIVVWLWHLHYNSCGFFGAQILVVRAVVLVTITVVAKKAVVIKQSVVVLSPVPFGKAVTPRGLRSKE